MIEIALQGASVEATVGQLTKGNRRSTAAARAASSAFPPPAPRIAAAPPSRAELEAILGATAYIAVAFVAYYINKIPGLGQMITTPIFLVLHLAGAILGLAYAFRYNRNGKRMPLLPKGKSDDSSDE